MKILIMNVGLPRSGKSSFSKKIKCPMVNPDSVRMALHGNRFNRNAEAMVWTIVRYMIISLFEAGHDIVILDATNINRLRRAEWIDHRWYRQFMYFDTSVDECKKRAIDNDQEYLLSVIDRMSTISEKPSIEELSIREKEFYNNTKIKFCITNPTEYKSFNII